MHTSEPRATGASAAGVLICLLAAFPFVARPAMAQTPNGRNSGRFVVVIDAAHGGDDNGARLGDAAGGQQGGQASEKSITLAMSVRLRSLLAARGFTVVTTRESNVTLDSDARAQIANRAVASAAGSACLSLHASEAGSGAHIFVSSLAPTAPTRFAAWKTAQAGYVERSTKFAGVVNSAFEQSGQGGGSGPVPATLGRASLPGIDSMTCPALAIEIAPVRTANGKVIADVTDADYQMQVVQALVNALVEWKSETDGGADTGRGASASGGGQTP
ncbi:N-acetylmuramoyl-L-alanine amidase [Acidicapsa dinghuensis]|uniref:N-acetylmuramoyl-L-alanine amidase n=1 Tax=Acidicapsa dinghuensis TaxID=2218256 RepID=A0ABW1EH17_9BACT|nr:N-acetylmuramoyl-L-alanine amidase [Acidicapsa dinghuensis]